MKNIVKNSAYLLLLSLLASCEKEYVAIDNASDAAWFTSETNKHPDAYRINLGTTISFMDASQGCKSHQWIIPSGARFMIDDFDIKNKNFVGQIDPTKGSTSTNTSESVIFQKAGLTKVTLRDTFYEWVKAHDENPVEAVRGNGEWILKRDFAVDVYEDLKPAFNIYDSKGDLFTTITEDQLVNGNDKSSWKILELELGEKFTIEDLTGRDDSGEIIATGSRPTGAKWEGPDCAQTIVTRSYDTTDGAIAQSNRASFAMKSMKPEGGEYFSNFTLTSQRAIPAQNVKKLIPIRVKSIASTQPYNVVTESTNVDINDTSIIKLTANGPFGSCAETAKDAFTLKAFNSAGAEMSNITIVGVGVNKNNSFFNITLSDKLYPGESVTIAYDNTKGEIKSADGRALNSFDEFTFAGIAGKSIVDYSVCSFEDPISLNAGVSSWTILPKWWNNGWISPVVRPGAKIEGNSQALQFNITSYADNKPPYYITQRISEKIPTGSYVVRMSVYIESVGTAWAGNIDIKDGATPLVNLHADLTKVNQWQVIEGNFSPAKDYDFKIMIFMGPMTTDFTGMKITIDDLEFIPSRPKTSN